MRRLGAEDSSIDIVGMDVIWTGEFANAGWVEEWTGPLKKQVTEKVFPNVIETASFEDKLYAAPFNTNTQLLWYRKDLVKQPPKTWDEMIEVAEGLKEAGSIQVQANRYEGYMVFVNALIESAGDRDPLRPRRSRPRTGRRPKRRSQVIGKLANGGAAPPSLSTSDEDTARLGFEAGESAFMTNYTFAYAQRQGRSAGHRQGDGLRPLPAGRREQAEQTAARRLQPRGQLLLEEQGRRLRSGRLPGQRQRARKPRSNSTACRPRARTSTPTKP